MTKAEAKKVKIADYLYNTHKRRLEVVTDIHWTADNLRFVGPHWRGYRFPLFTTVYVGCREDLDESSTATYLLFKRKGE